METRDRIDAETTTPGQGLPPDVWQRMRAEIESVEPFTVLEGSDTAVGRTMFDLPGSEDQTVVVLLPQERLQELPSQSLVRITSREGRRYLGIVVAGPFAEPDGLRGDAPLVVATNLQCTLYIPRYHGRVHVALLGEERNDALLPPRFRPLPNSLVHALTPEETAAVLRAEGEVRLGLAVGHEHVVVGAPSARKSVLPRHTAFLGTTGSGKSTSVAGFIAEAQRENFALVVLDVEGEYARIHEPATDATMVQVLHERGRIPQGVPQTRLYHLVGRECAAPDHPRKQAFCLRFEDLSPYAIAALLDMTEPQQDRFSRAYDSARQLLRELRIFPATPDDERRALDWDEFEAGYPRMTLALLLDVVSGFIQAASKDDAPFRCYSPELQAHAAAVEKRVKAAKPENAISWKTLAAKLWRLHRLRVFDVPRVPSLDPAAMVQPGVVSLIDLSDTESPQLNNLVIASLLRGIQRAQECAYAEATAAGAEPPRTLVVIEEAHEFLSASRVDRMPVLFEQVERIAKRGRKRWLGLVFVTQLPQHLPPQLLGLVNNFVIHKISDASVIQRLQRTIPGIDDSLWKRVPALAPGQAVVSLTSLQRPLLVSMDPAPCALRMVD